MDQYFKEENSMVLNVDLDNDKVTHHGKVEEYGKMYPDEIDDINNALAKHHNNLVHQKVVQDDDGKFGVITDS